MSEYCLEIGSLKRIYILETLLITIYLLRILVLRPIYSIKIKHINEKRIGNAGCIIFKATIKFLENHL